MSVEWYFMGEQIVHMKRGCAPKENEASKHCGDGEVDNVVIWKTCEDTCQGANCNNKSHSDQVKALFDSGNGNLECHSCTWARDQFGGIIGGSNEACTKPDVSDENFMVKCPIFANAACFTAASWHLEGSIEVEEDFKGCSTFRLNNDEPVCLDWEFDELSYQSCKSTCNSNGCNSKTPQRTNSCHNCEVIVNHLGNAVGTGDINCFDDPTDDVLVDCGVGATCRTKLAVELSFSGYQVTKVTRECSPKGLIESDKCSEGELGFFDWTGFKWKTCHDDCEGSGCNDNAHSDHVQSLFDQRNGDKLECHSCIYAKDQEGAIIGGSKLECQNQDTSEEGFLRECPVYANAACYAASTWHYEGPLEIEEDYKGCSPFKILTENQCQPWTFDGSDYETCLSSCEENGCNWETATKPSSSAFTSLHFAFFILSYFMV